VSAYLTHYDDLPFVVMHSNDRKANLARIAPHAGGFLISVLAGFCRGRGKNSI